MIDINKILDQAFEKMDSLELTDEEIIVLNNLKSNKPDFSNLLSGDVESNLENIKNFQKDLEEYANSFNNKK